ncbi:MULTISPECIES: response regulator transcription factor [Dyella]|uniref:Response regulator transcription factor n=2 Tax=Dyella TaxID=231454 RepID=A0A4R0Z2F3_9GAMM|nr:MULTISPECIES: response regulator transcription factor [Dyella]TBR39042.1 response regulator transcription factor [Dyella terrae]TCI13366.1 response regulator transcription factor [Dyella soli]
MTVPADQSIRIILADDHPIIRKGVLAVLEGSEIQVVGEASCPVELLSLLDRIECDAVVTDYVMPSDSSPDGIRLIERLRSMRPQLPVIVLTMLRNVGLLQALLATGVRAIVDKSTAMSEVHTAIRLATAGHIFVSSTFEGRLARFGAHSVSRLTDREGEVIRLLVAGMSVTEIARKLDRSVKTVSKQKTDAMKKLGLRSDMEIYAYAVEAGY